MNFAILDVLMLASVAISAALGVVLLMVYFELGPVAGLVARRRWLLVGALGSGVLTFSLKMFLVVWIAEHPPQPEAGSSTLAVGTHKAQALAPEHYRWLPLDDRSAGLTASPVRWQALPEPEALSPAQQRLAQLGERLFFEKALSRDHSLSCASCHDVKQGAGDDGRVTAVGVDGQTGPRNTPTVWNTAYQTRLFWDGRADSLEAQALGPLLNPIEMGMPDAAAVVARIEDQPGYRAAFAAAFGDARISAQRIASAIAAYERTLVTGDTPYDHFVRGDLQALSEAQLRGMALFESLGCVSCHAGPNFSAASRFVQTGAWRAFPTVSTPYQAQFKLSEDTGAGPAGQPRGVWRVPSLRNVALTAPYFHNGSVDSLEQAVRIMAAVQLGRTGPMLVWSSREQTLQRRNAEQLSDAQVDDLVAFLHALSSERLQAQIAAAPSQAARYAGQ